MLGMASALIWEALGISWAWAGPGLARGRQKGLDCIPVRAGPLFYWDPGIQVTAKGRGDLGLLGPTINLTTA